MTRIPDPEPFNRRLWLLLTSRTSITVGATLLIALAGGTWWAWIWIHERLAPLVEQNLNQLLGRPVELGEVERVWFTSLRFGASSIPATPTDRDRVTTQAVEVEFSPLQLLLNRTLQLNVTLVQPNAYIEQAKDGRWISTTIQPQEEAGWIRTNLQTIRLRNASVVLQPTLKPDVPNAPVSINQINGLVRFLDNNQQISFDVVGKLARGGSINIAGETRLAAQQTNLMVRGQNLLATDIGRLIASPIGLQAGRISGNLTAQFRPQQSPEITGIATLNGVAVQIANLPQRFVNTNGTLRFQGTTIAFDTIRTRFGSVPAQINGTLNTETGFDLTAQVQSVSAKNLLNTLKINAPVPISGTLRAQLQLQGQLQQPVLSGVVSILRSAQIDRVAFRSISSRFQLTTAGAPPQISFSEIRAIPQAGGQITGSGQVRLDDRPTVAFTLRANDVPGDTIARLYGAAPAITIGDISAIARVSGSTNNLQTVVQFRVPEATYPGSGVVLIANQGTVLLRDATFNIAGGTVQARGQLANGQFQATVTADQVRLNQFSQALRGQLSGDVQLSGNSFQLADIRANGRLRFSQGLAIVQEPLTAQVRWTGEQLQIQRATAPGLLASGTVAVQTEGAQAPQISGFNLNVQAQGYDLQDLDLNLPGNVALVGQADFNGRVTGTPTAPNANGDLQLRNLQVNGVAFDPLLAGSLNFQAGQRTELQLAGRQVTGTQDQIALTLGSNNRPTAFFIQRDQAIAKGTAQGDTLLINVQDFPVAVLQNLVPGAARNFGTIAGELSGTIALNLNRFTAEGDVAIANPQVGRISADVFRGRFRFADGVATLTGGELLQGDSRVALSGSFQTEGTRPIQFQIGFDQARIQNVLQTLSLFEFADLTTGLQSPDLADAAALQTSPIDFSNSPIITQLRRLAEIETLLAQQQTQREETSSLPPLSALQGRLNGAIAVTGSLQTGLAVNFDLRGSDWQWSDYEINRVVAQGTFANGVLTVQPLQIAVEGGTLAFRGQVGTEALTGQLQVAQLPLELLQPFLGQRPVAVAGRLNAAVNLSGSLNNPSAIGELSLVNGSLNNQPIQQAQLDFRYANARLNFDSDVLLAGTQPLEIMGSVPISLPFASTQPTNNQIRLRASVQDDGLALLNGFTNQVTWVDGQGQLDVAVTGTLNQPIIQGTVVVQDATLNAQALSQPLTNVAGRIQFNGDRISVERLQARYNQGQIVAQGILPISATQDAVQPVVNPLTVSSNNLDLNLKGLYQGEVSGNVVITGSARSPQIGGTVRLMDGQVLIGESASANPENPSDSTTAATATPAISTQSAIAFNNLQLILANDVQVSRPPLLSFEAEGGITLNGTLANPRPDGVIRLTGGEINLFTTQFRLARGYAQTARFVPSQGLDPILDVRLVALVPEVTGSRLPTSPLSSEIVDNSIADASTNTIGTLRTVRVQSRVTGPASELSENLELTSSPSRSEAEIIALIGGGFINTLEQGGAVLGLANLAGSTVLRDLQGTITDLGQAIGLSEFRIYPALVTEPDSDASVLGLAAEAVVDISNNVSVSVSKVITTSDPVRYNLLYRINDQILVRGSTDFAGDSRASVEYEARF